MATSSTPVSRTRESTPVRPAWEPFRALPSLPLQTCCAWRSSAAASQPFRVGSGRGSGARDGGHRGDPEAVLRGVSKFPCMMYTHSLHSNLKIFRVQDFPPHPQEQVQGWPKFCQLAQYFDWESLLDAGSWPRIWSNHCESYVE
jgi:hypothetical protein